MKRKRGRQLGHKLSAESKRKISEGRKGLKHSQETIDKIKVSMKKYFDNRRN